MIKSLPCLNKSLDLSRPVVMGILNITPDSFSDGGRYFSLQQAVDQAAQMQQEGAAIIDVGGESTRPGAASVTPMEEAERVVPVIEELARSLTIPVSVDTSKATVMLEAASAGAGLINDVRALREPEAMQAAASTGLPVCLMHMLGQPRTMQQEPAYADVVQTVADFFSQRILACEQAGIQREKLLLDPGFGFGKTLQHNIRLLRELDQFKSFDLPLLVGLSRKSMMGQILDDAPIDGRLYGSIAAALMAVQKGCSILRVHDVKATVDALKVWQVLQ